MEACLGEEEYNALVAKLEGDHPLARKVTGAEVGGRSGTSATMLRRAVKGHIATKEPRFRRAECGQLVGKAEFARPWPWERLGGREDPGLQPKSKFLVFYLSLFISLFSSPTRL